MVLKLVIVAFLTTLALDALWIYLNFNMYKSMYSRIQGSSINFNALYATYAYIFILLSVFLLVVPKLDHNDGLCECALKGGVVGLCIYGVYNFTNLALFNSWSPFVAIIDTLWGGVLYTCIAYALVGTQSI